MAEPETPESLNHEGYSRQDWINRKYIQEEEKFPQAKTFHKGLDFIEKNHQEDDWFLQIETFDPHEPFYSSDKYKELYDHDYSRVHFDWPKYQQVEESDDVVEHIKYQYAALLTMCDKYLGKVLDIMDKYNLWEDTMLIVTTDHGYLLGEHGWWAKCSMPFYNEIAHTPLFIWDPRCEQKGVRRDALVQTIDLAPTLLDYFSLEIPDNMEGVPLKDTIASNKQIREAALFGLFGAHVNVTDGRYVYMRAPEKPGNDPLYEYTLMPTRHGAGRAFIEPEEMTDMELVEPFSFTKGCKLLKINTNGWHGKDYHPFGTMLFDLENDPYQQELLQDEETEQKMKEYIIKMLKNNDAPEEQFTRLGLEQVD